MNIGRIVPAVAASALLLTGCTAPEPVPAPSVSVAPAATESAAPSATPTPSPTPESKTNQRGEIIKDIGEVAGMFPEPGAPSTLSFKVTSIEAITCDAPYAPEPNGIPIAISLEIETTADFEGPIIQNGVESGIDFSPYYWTGYADNGTRMNAIDSNITQNCLADETKVLPTWISKGEKVNGIVVLDVATPTGSIAFDPAGFGGWVWEYPSK